MLKHRVHNKNYGRVKKNKQRLLDDLYPSLKRLLCMHHPRLFCTETLMNYKRVS